MKWIFFVMTYAVSIGLILTFLRGATYKGNIAEDPKYYGKAKND